MTSVKQFLMGSKVETIYTTMAKNLAAYRKQNKVYAARQSISSFEEHLKRNPTSKACYVYINGILMPVLSV